MWNYINKLYNNRPFFIININNNTFSLINEINYGHLYFF